MGMKGHSASPLEFLFTAVKGVTTSFLVSSVGLPATSLTLSLVTYLAVTQFQSVGAVLTDEEPHLGLTLPPHSSRVLAARCGSTSPVTVNTAYIILSPGYPTPYHPYTYCRWNFYSIDGSDATLQVQCQLFEMEASSGCSSGAFFALQTLDDQEAQRFCGNDGPQGVTTSNSLTIHFWGGWRLNTDKRGVYCAVTSVTIPQTPLPPPPSTTCRCGRRGTNLRIVGGENANLHEWPWMTLLILPGGGLCGGTLINDRFVLTAAHCIDKTVLPRNAVPTVVLGEHKRSVTDETPYTRVVRVARVIPHEDYVGTGDSKNNDIGLVELASPLDLGRSPGIAPACPPFPKTTDEAHSVITLGWGFTSASGEQADVLQKVELLTVPLEKCRDQYQENVITGNMICAAATNKDSCFTTSRGSAPRSAAPLRAPRPEI